MKIESPNLWDAVNREGNLQLLSIDLEKRKREIDDVNFILENEEERN